MKLNVQYSQFEKKTLFLKPSWIIPNGGLTGHHEIKYSLTNGNMTVHSEKGKKIESYYDFYDFARQFDLNESKLSDNENPLQKFINDFNNVMVNKNGFQSSEYNLKPIREDESGLLNSMSAIVR